jgi:pyruvate kinase
METPVAVLLDLQGPKMRIGEFKSGNMQLKRNSKVSLKVTDSKSDGSFIPIQYGNFMKDVRLGDRVLLDDGNFALKIIEKKPGQVKVRVINGGTLTNKKGINLPDSLVTANPITKKDIDDLKAGISAGVDFVAISFVRCAADIRLLRKIIAKTAPHIEIIAKIERHDAVNDIEAIVAEADAVMVARGDLGVELPAEQVPVIKLKIMQLCHHMSKPVIIATQMLESMIVNPRPTRAEVSDVGSSVRFYVDAMMLSAETASGKHPVESVVQMSKTAIAMENYQCSFHRIMPWEWRWEKPPPRERALAYSACRLSELLSAKAIIVISETGFTPKRVASPHPNVPIFAFTPSDETVRKLTLVRNVTPFKFSFKNDMVKNIDGIFRLLKKKKLLKKGDRIVLTSGLVMGVKGSTKLIMVEDVP